MLITQNDFWVTTKMETFEIDVKILHRSKILTQNHPFDRPEKGEIRHLDIWNDYK